MGENRDVQLLQLIAKGSKTAFEKFYNMHVSFVLQIATQIIGDYNEAEDVTHEIFLEVYEKPKQYKAERGSVKAWLAVITKNRCIDRLRKKKPLLVQKLELLDSKDAIETELTVLHKIEKELIVEALQQIPKKQREVIYGAYFEGKTQKELAESLNRPLGTVKSLARYGLNNLRKQKQLLHWIKFR